MSKINGGYYAITDEVWNANRRGWSMVRKDMHLNRIHWRYDRHIDGWECCPQYMKLFFSEDGLKYPFYFGKPHKR